MRKCVPFQKLSTMDDVGGRTGVDRVLQRRPFNHKSHCRTGEPDLGGTSRWPKIASCCRPELGIWETWLQHCLWEPLVVTPHTHTHIRALAHAGTHLFARIHTWGWAWSNTQLGASVSSFARSGREHLPLEQETYFMALPGRVSLGFIITRI